jgi:UDP-2,3-diacylglucosamine hydrolase
VEATEGTDNMLVRVAALRSEGRLTKPRGIGVLVKAPKPGQDRRFDLPAIGPKTIENVTRAGLAGLAVAAGSAIVAEPDKTSAAADNAGIFFIGVAAEAAEATR